MPFVEIDKPPLDRLTRHEREILANSGFECRPDGRYTFVFRPGISDRATIAGKHVVEKLHRMRGLRLPEPPATGDWRIWQHRQDGWKYEALAAKDSPVRGFLRGKTPESRKQLAMRAVKRVDTFRRTAPAWWFRAMRELLATD